MTRRRTQSRSSLKPKSKSKSKVSSKTPKEKISKSGTLVIIGGKEDKVGSMRVLRKLCDIHDQGKVVVASVASEMPQALWEDYYSVFRKLGVKHINHLAIDRPEDARQDKALKILDDATMVFFTGGDQLRITTKLGGTAIVDRLQEIYDAGGIIAGTSAGASMMGEIMLIGGENQESHKVGNWMMAPGLNFMKETIIDQHFAQRGRIGRLLGAVAINPGVLGIGIDEDTAIIVNRHNFRVCGSNAVYVVDGRSVTYTNVCEAEAERTMSMHDVKLHILSADEQFDLRTRRPTSNKEPDLCAFAGED